MPRLVRPWKSSTPDFQGAEDASGRMRAVIRIFEISKGGVTIKHSPEILLASERKTFSSEWTKDISIDISQLEMFSSLSILLKNQVWRFYKLPFLNVDDEISRNYLIWKVLSSVGYCKEQNQKRYALSLPNQEGFEQCWLLHETFWTTKSLKMPKPKDHQQLVTTTQHVQQRRSATDF